MTKIFNPENRVIGRPCLKHPELNGLRVKANHNCVQCDRDYQKARRDKKREAAGKVIFKPMLPEEAMERTRQRARARSQQRRLDPQYNAKQVERKRDWRTKNADHYREVSRAYDAKQLAENMQRRLAKNLRHRLRKAMLGETRGVSAVRDLGMTIPEFRAYLESKFEPGMSWENYGEWHVDHIRPLISFDLTDIGQGREACNFRNLQPLWALDNQKKGSKPRPETWAANWDLATLTVGAK